MIATQARWRVGRWSCFALMAVWLPTLGCGDDGFNAPPLIEPSQLYSDLELNHRAVTFSMAAPYNTLTLSAHPRNALREPMTSAELQPRYLSNDIEAVIVTPDGVMRAQAVTTQPILVTAVLTVGNLTHRDSVWVRVVDAVPPPVLASLSVHPVPPDSAKLAYFSGGFTAPIATLPVQAVDRDGAIMPAPMISFRSSDPEVATIGEITGIIKSIRAGRVLLDASTTVFGVTKVDTVQYRIGRRLFHAVALQWNTTFGGASSPAFIPSEIRVATGALVVWASIEDFEEVDVVFTEMDRSNVAAANTFGAAEIMFRPPFSFSFICSLYRTDCLGTGDFVIPPFNPDLPDAPRAHMRVLTKPGIYEYYSTRLQTGGRVVVLDDDM